MHHHRVEVEVITMPQVHLLRLQVVDSTRAMVENQEVVTPITRTALARDLINNISRKISLLLLRPETHPCRNLIELIAMLSSLLLHHVLDPRNQLTFLDLARARKQASSMKRRLVSHLPFPAMSFNVELRQYLSRDTNYDDSDCFGSCPLSNGHIVSRCC
jgi:hypothetical protein